MGKTFETIDPRTGEVIARIAEGDKEDVDLAVKAARAAFDNGPWPRFPGAYSTTQMQKKSRNERDGHVEAERGRIMMKFADLIDQHVEELAILDTVDAGRLFNFGKAVDIPQVAEKSTLLRGVQPTKSMEMLSKCHASFKPYVARTHWCFGAHHPMEFPKHPVLCKGQPFLSRRAGVPDGVLNVITGFGQTAGAAISYHMDIDKVSFTGSTEV
ncbi:aldehyde dehydrogenase 2C4, partial [Prunus dulcis]